MPLKLRPPRPGVTPYYSIRGTYLGVRISGESTGTRKRQVAEQLLRKKKEEIERGAVARPGEPNFAEAAINYMTTGGERRFLTPLIKHFGTAALSAIDQAAIDRAAAELYPDADAPTRNRQVYTPMSAVLKRAGIERKVKRPKGWRGSRATSWLEPAQAFALFAAADKIDLEFGLFLRVLVYTGMRLSEALSIQLRHVNLDEATIYLPKTKNQVPRPVFLTPDLVTRLRNQPARPERPKATPGQRLPNGVAGRSQEGAGVPFLQRGPDARLFRFHAGGRLRAMLAQAMQDAGLSFPRRQGGFHLCCHTYGTWMRRYGDLDTMGLTRTQRWKDPESADRYIHTMPSEEARRAVMLPTEQPGNRPGRVAKVGGMRVK